MRPVDPTYPLRPIASFLCSTLLAVILVASIARRAWNVGLFILCFWVGLEVFLDGINSIVWADNADLKAFAYCDIVTHIHIFTNVVKPACSLIIARQLYKIASMPSVEVPSLKEKRINLAVELGLGLGIPTLVTAVFYYIVQPARFQVLEGLGCASVLDVDGLGVLLVLSWQVTLPLISIVFYSPRIVKTFYQHACKASELFKSRSSSCNPSGRLYFRIVLLGCLDILFTLPIGIINIVTGMLQQKANLGVLKFYLGWEFIHPSEPGVWDPSSVMYDEITVDGWGTFIYYFPPWSSIVLGFAIFALFGFTSDSRETYSSLGRRGLSLIGMRMERRSDSELPVMTFDPTQHIQLKDHTMASSAATCSDSLYGSREGTSVDYEKCMHAI